MGDIAVLFAVRNQHFLQSADYYLISQALAHGHAVVTREVPANSTRKVKIPNVCIGVGVKCMNTFEMLRVERVRLVLEQGNGTGAS